MWPLNSRGGGKALVGGQLKDILFCGFPSRQNRKKLGRGASFPKRDPIVPSFTFIELKIS